MIRVSVEREYTPIFAASGDAQARCTLLQRKLDAVRDYVELCAADELEPTVILDLIDHPHG